MRAASERGMATPQFVLASGLALLLFVAFANLIVFQYGRGVVRAALDEGVRAAAQGSPDSSMRCSGARWAGISSSPAGSKVTSW